MIGNFESYMLEVDKKRYSKEFINPKIKIKALDILVDYLSFQGNQLVILYPSQAEVEELVE